jgi:hypothetical protein
MVETRACNLSGDLVQATFDPSDIPLEETRQAAVSLDTVHLVLKDRDAVLLCNASKPKGNREDERETCDEKSPEAPMTRTTRRRAEPD